VSGDQERQASALSLLKRFWQYARHQKAWLLLGISMIPIVAALTTVRPLLVKQAVDVDLAVGDYEGLRVLGIAFLGAVVIEFLAFATQVYSLQRAGHKTIAVLRRKIFHHVLQLPNRFFDKNPIGSLLTRTTSDVEALSETLSFGVFTILTDVTMILVTLAVMFSLSAKMTLISLSLAPILVLLVRYFASVLRRLQLEIRKAQSVRNGYLTEQLMGITVVQLFGREEASRDTYAQLGARYLRATKTSNIFDALLYSIMDGISAFCIALLIYFAAPEVVHESGALTLGLLFAFVEYLQRIFVPIKEFSNKLATIQRAAASLERVYGLLDEPTESRSLPGAADPLSNWQGGLSVRDLRFRYQDEGEDVLAGISFDIEPGEVVAVVGRTGSGKTSLARVLTRFYDGYRGSVQLHGDQGDIELSEIEPDQLRRHILSVQQDVFLFDDEVAFNVALGDPAIAADERRLGRALDTVQATDFLRERGGASMHVGERGRNLSAGEIQLVAFARVAARSPTMLILDEATASVDTVTERKVQAAIERLLEGRTVLVIAHRLSTVRHADKIIVMSEGRIAESGNHDELMELGGIYAELYESGFAEDGAE
jgi:ATP-binding cassette subfamily B protein